MIAIATDPVSLIMQGAPHLIHDDRELDIYTQQLFELTAKDNPTEPEQETIDLLTLLIESYERKYRLPKATGLEVLAFLMGQHHLKQQDLIPELGSIANISLILAGKRNLTIAHARALGARFNVSPHLFLDLEPEHKMSRAGTGAGSLVEQIAVAAAGTFVGNVVRGKVKTDTVDGHVLVADNRMEDVVIGVAVTDTGAIIVGPDREPEPEGSVPPTRKGIHNQNERHEREKPRPPGRGFSLHA